MATDKEKVLAFLRNVAPSKDAPVRSASTTESGDARGNIGIQSGNVQAEQGRRNAGLPARKVQRAKPGQEF